MRLGTLGVLLALAAWELAARAGLGDVPPASDVSAELARQLGSGPFWSAAGATLGQWAIGMALTVAVAVPLGLLMGTVEAVWRALRPIVEFFRPVPGVALIPLAVLLWGLSTRSVIALIVFGTVWSLLVQTMYGAHDVDAGARETARVYGLTRLDRARFVVLPSALPYIATGLRIAAATALIIAISAEIVIGVAGLGHDVALAQTAGELEAMYALILTSGLLGIAIHLAFSRLERRFLRWHQSQRVTA